MTHVKR